MKERPLLFTPENAQKCHVGTKTQTRRIVKPQPTVNEHGYFQWTPRSEGHNGVYTPDSFMAECPYGVTGDRLWVREAWADVHPLQAEGRFSIPGRAGIPGPPPVDYRVIYRGEGEYPRLHFQAAAQDYPYRELCKPGCQRKHIHPEESFHGWEPSIHMPRRLCRTVLEITEIRVQRVQEISYEDEGAEGVMLGPDCNDRHSGFIALWDSINGPGSWDANPWVWAITFQKVG